MCVDKKNKEAEIMLLDNFCTTSEVRGYMLFRHGHRTKKFEQIVGQRTHPDDDLTHRVRREKSDIMYVGIPDNKLDAYNEAFQCRGYMWLLLFVEGKMPTLYSLSIDVP